ncbi:uncharacterized protein LOC123323016 [Coccinella septempunctata]|uniref:uncharacterized protein LOC123323016 n=1 Tax=Coccinella septempunctata TaxID=41139 RepID=UPI001D08580D|nr:uncharacterized protein LOC123323016 [Coccinella septempunctata]
MWKLIAQQTHTKKHSSSSDDTITADEVNEYLTDIGRKIAEKASPTLRGSASLLHKVGSNCADSLFLSPVTEDEIVDIVKKMKNKNTKDYYGLTVNSIKCIIPYIKSPLSKIINDCFTQGIFPIELKTAIVTPIHKSGDAENLSNYRPISVLPVLSKIFEMALKKRLVDFLENKALLHPGQHGFRQSKSTITAMLDVFENILEACNVSEETEIISIDLSKAFDSVCHEILLMKLQHYGVRGLVHKLIQSYLTNRRQVVKWNGQRSDFVEVKCGVPQGNICTDVSVLNQFDTGSDHRLVRASFRFNLKTERSKLIRTNRFPTAEELESRREDYQNELERRLEPTETLSRMDINELNRKITNDIHVATRKICMTTQKKKSPKLQPETLQLIEQRKRTSRDTLGYQELNKKIHKEVRKNIRSYNTKMIENAIEDNSNMRVLRAKLSTGKHEITKMKDQQGTIISDRTGIAEHIKRFYTHLYTSTRPDPRATNKVICNVGSEDIPEISKQEIKAALRQMKNRKSPGEDRITCEMLKMGGVVIERSLQILLNKCLLEGNIPDTWKNAEMVLLFKKGDNGNVENYRPISLLSHMYKLLTRIITNRLTNKMDAYQPAEQAGFRKGFSTTDHLQAIRILIEKTTEYNIPLHLAFVDFYKAFDSVEPWAFLQAMDDARIDSRYTNLIKAIYKNATFHVKINEDLKTDRIEVKRGVRQGDIISPKLFTLALENDFKTLQRETKGVNIDGLYLSHLRFADDIVIISSSMQELSEMIKQLNEASKRIGLKMNIAKTKIISNTEETIHVDGTKLENVKEYVYLGHAIKIGKENQTAEIKRRIRLAWAGFGKMNYIFKNKSIPINLKRRAFDTCILPVATYGLETMAMTKKTANQMRVMQRAMERVMLGISLRDRKRNEDIRQKTRVIDVIERIAELKWQWVGHVARKDRTHWTYRLVHWRPRRSRRSAGRPQKRWLDDIKKQAGIGWFRTAQDRTAWRNLKEAYVQEWTRCG